MIKINKAFLLLLFILILSRISNAQTTYFWVGGNGWWEDGLHWSLSSGGPVVPGAYPGLSNLNDNAIFDNNSFNAINQLVSVGLANIFCHDMQWLNIQNGGTFVVGSNITISGSLTYAPNMVLQNTSGNTTFTSGSTEIINTGGIQNIIKNLTFNGNGMWTLQNFLNVDNDITFDKGTLISDNYGLMCSKFISTPANLNNYRVLNLGNSLFTIKLPNNPPYLSWNVNNVMHTFHMITAGSSLIRFIGTSGLSTMHAGEHLFYDNIEFMGSGRLEILEDTIHDMTFHGNGEIIGDSSILHDAVFDQYGMINGNHNIFHDVTISKDGDIGNLSLSGRNVDNNIFHIVDIGLNGRVYGNHNVFFDLLFTTQHQPCWILECHYCPGYPDGELHGNHDTITNKLAFYREGKMFGTLNYINEVEFWCDSWVLQGSNTFFTMNLHRYFEECYHYIANTNYTTPSHLNVLTFQSDSIQYLLGDFNLIGQIMCQHTVIQSTSTSVPAFFHSDSILSLDYIELRHIHSSNPQNISDTAKRSIDGGGNYFWDFTNLYSAVQSGNSSSIPAYPCWYDNNGSITLSPIGGIPSYEFAILLYDQYGYPFWSPYQTDSIFSPLFPNTYQINILDSYHCIFTTSVVVSSPPIITMADTIIQDLSCFGFNDGSIQILASGGTPPLSYSINGGSYISSNTFSGLAPGDYTITIMDNLGCTRTFGPFSIEEPPQLSLTTGGAQVVIQCPGDSTAIITAIGGGGTPPYQYTFAGPFSSPYVTQNYPISSNNTLSNIHAGVWYVTVTDQNGCEATDITQRTEPQPLTIDIDITSTNNCADTTHFRATASVGGGTAPYINYSWYNSLGTLLGTGSSNVSPFLTPGTYRVIVKDLHNCADTTDFSISILTSKIDTIIDKLCNGGENTGYACVSGLGGSGLFGYHWSNNWNFSCLMNVDTGYYYVTITDTKYGCKVYDSVYINQPDTSLSMLVFSDSTTCQGLQDGAAWVIAHGGTGPYTYYWSGNQTNDTISQLWPGIYSITVTDAHGCTVFGNTTIFSPPTGIVSFDTGWYCIPQGYWIQANITGGTPPFSYAWSPVPGNNSIIVGYPGILQHVLVTDANNCPYEGSVIVSEHQVNLTVHHAHCFGDNSGYATAHPSGGNPLPYVYQWFQSGNLNVLSTNDTAYGLIAGSYLLVLTDSHGCIDSVPFTITQPSAPVIVSMGSQSSGNICSYHCNSIALASPNGGTPPYTYLWSPGNQTTSFISNLCSGTYEVTVTDSHACIMTGSSVITAPPTIIVDSIHIDSLRCNVPDSTGNAIIYAHGGTGNLTYRVDGGLYQNNNIFPGLSQGTHNFTIRDAANCTFDISANIPAPPVLGLNLTTTPTTGFGLCDGSAQSLTTGGIPPYNYLWSNGQIIQNITNLCQGIYCLTVTDAHGCPANSCTIVSSPGQLVFITNSENIKCHDSLTGAIHGTITGGIPPYTFTWNPGLPFSPQPIVTSNTINWNNLPAGTYSVTVTDFNSISETQTFVLTQPSQFQLNINFTDSICTGTSPAQGSALATITGNTPPYSFSWYGGTGTNNTPLYDSLTIGNYSLQIFDVNLCKISSSVSIHPYTDPVAVFSIDSVCKGTASVLRDSSYATGTHLTNAYLQWGDGQVINYTYPPNPPQSIQHMYQNASAYANPYQVKLLVKDNHGCYSDTTILPAIVLPIPTTIFSYDTACFGNKTTMIDLSNDNGSPIISRNWKINSQTVPYQVIEQHVFTSLNVNLNPAKLIVSNAFCADSVTHLIPIDSLPFPSFSSKDSICIPGMVRFTDLSTPNGSPLAGWFWQFGEGNSSANNNPVHTYLQTNSTYQVKLTVTSSRGCSDSIQHSIYVSPERLFSIVANPVCFGDTMHFIGIINPTNENWVTQYWTFGDGQTSFAINPWHVYESPGIYTAILVGTDAEGCENFAFNDNIIVNPLPVADFLDTVFCDQSPVKFYNTSVSNAPGPSTYIWNLGGTIVSTTATFLMHTFPAPGSYPVTLIVINSNDCSDTITKIIVIEPLPSADFKADTACYGTATQFTELSVPVPEHWVWNFGDPASGIINTDSVENPVHLFSSAGLFSVKLKIVTNNGCLDSITKLVVVQSNPAAAFTTDPLTHCLRDTLVFINQSTYQPNSSPSSWSWNFGNPASGFSNTSALQNPVHHFNQAGQFNISLIVSSNPGKGCTDTVSHFITINPHPIADFTSSLSCIGDSSINLDASQAVNGILTASFWNFGALPYSYGMNAGYLFPASGNYNIIHAVTNSDLCTDTISKIVQVMPLPQAAFSHSTLCLNNAVHFTDLSDPVYSTVTGWDWNFGDPLSNFNNASTLQNPDHTYENTGTYIVRLAVRTLAGCRDTIYDTLIVMPTPVASFTATDTCMGLPMLFTDLSTSALGNIVTWNWSFGNATTANTQNPVVTYNISGIYLVTLTVMDQAQCVNTVTQPVFVHALPSPSFTAAITCTGNPVAFTNYTNGGGFPITSWIWNFGDPGNPPNSANSQDTFHLYQNPGLYTVSLTATNSKSCTNTSVENIFVPPGVTADFSVGNNACQAVGSNIQFIDQSFATGTNVSNWYWDFDDGTISTLQNPIHVFLATGTFLVSLTVTTLDHCTQTITKPIVIDNVPYVAFSYQPGNLCLGETAHFIGFASGNNMPVLNWFWDFGDPPANSTLQNPDHIFSNQGSYQVHMIIEDSHHCLNSYASSISVYPKPMSNFTISYPVCEHDSACFTDNSYYNGSFPYQWFWNFGDPLSTNLNTSTLPNPCHYFISPVNHDVSLTVINSYGCSDSVSQNVIYQTGQGPICQFTFNTGTLCFGDSTTFINQSAGSGAPITTYHWNFGDIGTGNLSTKANPRHLFTIPGTYTVTLIITDSHGCSSSSTQQVVIKTTPFANFSFSTPVCLNALATFTDNSITGGVPIVSWQWKIDNIIQPSNGPVIQQAFSNPGLHNIQLTVTNQDGCDSTVIKTLLINPKPQALFSYSPNTTVCDGATVTFTENSVPGAGNLVTRSWNFGDATTWNTSPGSFITHVYNNTTSSPITYQAKLAIENSEGCRDTIIHTIMIRPRPVPDFTFSNISCLHDTIHFTGSSTTPNGGSIINWNWDFGDASSMNPTGTGQITTHVFSALTPSPWNYTITLNVYDGYCPNTVNQQLTVHPLPVADFTYDPACLGNTTQFHNNSSSVNGQITNWQWSFGSVLENPMYTFLTAGFSSVTLTITDVFSCHKSIQKEVEVFPLPIVAFSHHDTCTPGINGGQIHFHDLSQPTSSAIVSWHWQLNTGTSSSLQNPVQSFYPFNQNFPVTLTITSQQGCTNTLTQNVFVNLPLALDFTFSNACEGDSAHFLPTLLAPPNAQVNNWRWKFGDNTAQLITPDLFASHIFQNSGPYSVTLANNDNHGCWDSISHLVTIYPLPEPFFTYDTTFCADSVHFTNLSIPGNDSIISWYWDFGDTLSLTNNYSTLSDPVHQFFSNEEHLYHVGLTVMSLDSCTKTIFLPVYHGPCLTGSFTTPDTIACSGIAYHFVDNTILGNNVTNPGWYWNFGDPGSGPNNVSTVQNPTHIYLSPGQYLATLIVSATVNSIQIFDTVTSIILINPSPFASFVYDSCCLGDSIHFTNASSILSGQITAWVWTFGIGGPNPAYIQNPQPQIFSSSGLFNTTLSIISDQNCPSGVSYIVKVSPNPVANFIADPDSSCDLPLIVSFSDLSTVASGSITNYHYNFGTGTPVNLMSGNTQYSYTNYGVYTVSLTVSTDQQCKDSVVYNNLIHVNQRPEPDFSYTPEPVPITDPVAHFENTTTAYANYYCYWNFANLDSIANNCDPDFAFSMPGSYDVTLYVVDENQCNASVHHTVNVNADLTVFVPNAFTPDGNGDNDVFGVQGVYLDHTDFLMIIANRWGEIMYESHTPDEPWTGKIRKTENMAPDGVYAYYIRVRDLSGHRKEIKGYVTLVKKD